MIATTSKLQPTDLQALNDYLLSDRAPEDAMLLPDLDGFLTGVAIGPELIMPSEWLPRVWGDGEPVFDDGDQAQQILSLIMLRYNEILTMLRESPERYAPILWETPAGETIATGWAEGFMEAVRLRPDAWAPLFEERDAIALLIPILLVSGDETIAAAFTIEPEEESGVLEEAIDQLPAAVAGIDLFWKQRRGDVLSPPSPVTRLKAGRNEPCPCGSGRKFKRCCGAH